MILKVLIAVSVLQLPVVCEDLVFPEIKPGDGISIRYVSGDQHKIDSYATRVLDCDKLKELKEKIEIFPFLIDLDIRQKIGDTSQPSGKCAVYFANVPKLNLSLSPRRYTIVRSFIFMMDQYRKTDYFKQFDIAVESFSYSPLLQRFVFTDIDKLELEKQPSKDKSTIYRNMVTSFYTSLDPKVTLISSELLIFRKINDKIKPTPAGNILNHLEYYRTVDNKKSINDFLDLTPGNSTKQKPNLKLSIETTYYKDNLSVTYSVNSDKKTFKLENKNDLILFFICKRDKDNSSSNEDDTCINVYDKNMEYFSFEGISSMSTRYNIEIQESNLKCLNKGVENAKKLFEIYIVILPETIHGIIPDSIFLHSESSKDYLAKVEFVLCQNTLNDLVMYTKVDNKIDKQNFRFGKNIINVLGSANMYQVTTSLLTDEFSECKTPLTRVFLIDQIGNQLIFALDVSTQSMIVRSIYTRLRTGGAPYLTINKCKEEDRWYKSIELENEGKFIKTDMGGNIYPSEVFLRYLDDNTSKNTEITTGMNIESDCYTSYTDTNINLFYNNKDNRYINFYWNFNQESELSLLETERTIVYVSKKERDVNPSFTFESFALPIIITNVLFVSITMDKSALPYRIRFVYYRSDSTIDEILFSDDSKSLLKILPFGYSYNDEDSNTSSKYIVKNFDKCEAAYLSENEIVYQIEYKEYKNCNQLLELENGGTYVKIVCKLYKPSGRVINSPSADSYKPAVKKENQNQNQNPNQNQNQNPKPNPLASPGLYRVLRQAKEIQKAFLKGEGKKPNIRILI